jgi:hypothetical protein
MYFGVNILIPVYIKYLFITTLILIIFYIILTEVQFRLRKGLSTDKALYKFIGEILRALCDKMHVSGIFCDIAEAFCVNHDINIKTKFL